jgi:hypothetical protein
MCQKNVGYFCYFQNIVPSRQSPDGRINGYTYEFAQRLLQNYNGKKWRGKSFESADFSVFDSFLCLHVLIAKKTKTLFALFHFKPFPRLPTYLPIYVPTKAFKSKESKKI